jgi:hypothetical protein
MITRRGAGSEPHTREPPSLEIEPRCPALVALLIRDGIDRWDVAGGLDVSLLLDAG